jgi:hypothetical protein
MSTQKALTAGGVDFASLREARSESG